MQIATKEQIQEIRDVLDETLVWEYLRITSELKLALLVNNIATPDNLDDVLADYMRFESDALRSESEQNKLGV